MKKITNKQEFLKAINDICSDYREVMEDFYIVDYHIEDARHDAMESALALFDNMSDKLKKDKEVRIAIDDAKELVGISD